MIGEPFHDIAAEANEPCIHIDKEHSLVIAGQSAELGKGATVDHLLKFQQLIDVVSFVQKFQR